MGNAEWAWQTQQRGEIDSSSAGRPTQRLEAWQVEGRRPRWGTSALAWALIAIGLLLLAFNLWSMHGPVASTDHASIPTGRSSTYHSSHPMSHASDEDLWCDYEMADSERFEAMGESSHPHSH